MENTAKALGLATVESKEGEEILALLKCARSIGLTLFKQKLVLKSHKIGATTLCSRAPLFISIADLSIFFVERRIDEVVVMRCSKQVTVSAKRTQS